MAKQGVEIFPGFVAINATHYTPMLEKEALPGKKSGFIRLTTRTRRHTFQAQIRNKSENSRLILLGCLGVARRRGSPQLS